MRKYLIVALAACIAAVASFRRRRYCSGPDRASSSTVNVTPSKAGTKKKPKNTTYHARRRQQQHEAHDVRASTIFLAEERQDQPQGLPEVLHSATTICARPSCPKSAEVGGGDARRPAPASTATRRTRLSFRHAFKTNAPSPARRCWCFFIDDGPASRSWPHRDQAQEGVAASTASCCTSTIPASWPSSTSAQYNGLVALNVDDSTQEDRKNMLIASTGCNEGEGTRTRVDRRSSTTRSRRRPTTLSDTATAKCSK